MKVLKVGIRFCFSNRGGGGDGGKCAHYLACRHNVTTDLAFLQSRDGGLGEGGGGCWHDNDRSESQACMLGDLMQWNNTNNSTWRRTPILVLYVVSMHDNKLPPLLPLPRPGMILAITLIS